MNFVHSMYGPELEKMVGTTLNVLSANPNTIVKYSPMYGSPEVFYLLHPSGLQ